MKTIQPAILNQNWLIATKKDAAKKPVEQQEAIRTKKNWLEKDIVLNVGFKESIIRFTIMIFLPWPLLAIDHRLLIFVAPLLFYLEASAMTHFCPIRYIWCQWVQKKASPAICDLAKELDMPVEAL